MIAGASYRVEDLKAGQRRALIGARVVACYERSDDSDFNKIAVGTVVAPVEDEFKLWVLFDHDQSGPLGLFDDETVVVLSVQRAGHVSKTAIDLIKHADNSEDTFEDHVSNLELMVTELSRFIPRDKFKEVAKGLRRRINKIRRQRNDE